MSADDIKINALSVVVEYSDINDAEVEVPDEVVDQVSEIADEAIDELDIETYNQLLLDADGESDIEAIWDTFVNDWQKENQKKKPPILLEHHQQTHYYQTETKALQFQDPNHHS